MPEIKLGFLRNLTKEGRLVSKGKRIEEALKKEARSGAGSLTKKEAKLVEGFRNEEKGMKEAYDMFKKKKGGKAASTGGASNPNGGHKTSSGGGGKPPKNTNNTNTDFETLKDKVNRHGKKSLTPEERKQWNAYKDQQRKQHNVNSGQAGNGAGKDTDKVTVQPVKDHPLRDKMLHFGAETFKHPQTLAAWLGLGWLIDEHFDAQEHGLSLANELIGWASGYQYDENGKIIGVKGLAPLIFGALGGSNATVNGQGMLPELGQQILGKRATDVIGNTAEWGVNTGRNAVDGAGQVIKQVVDGTSQVVSDGYNAVKGIGGGKEITYPNDDGQSAENSEGQGYMGGSAAPEGMQADNIPSVSPNRYALDSGAAVGAGLLTFLGKNPLFKLGMLASSGYFGNRAIKDFQQYHQYAQPKVQQTDQEKVYGLSRR